MSVQSAPHELHAGDRGSDAQPSGDVIQASSEETVDTQAGASSPTSHACEWHVTMQLQLSHGEFLVAQTSIRHTCKHSCPGPSPAVACML